MESIFQKVDGLSSKVALPQPGFCTICDLSLLDSLQPALPLPSACRQPQFIANLAVVIARVRSVISAQSCRLPPLHDVIQACCNYLKSCTADVATTFSGLVIAATRCPPDDARHAPSEQLLHKILCYVLEVPGSGALFTSPIGAGCTAVCLPGIVKSATLLNALQLIEAFGQPGRNSQALRLVCEWRLDRSLQVTRIYLAPRVCGHYIVCSQTRIPAYEIPARYQQLLARNGLSDGAVPSPGKPFLASASAENSPTVSIASTPWSQMCMRTPVQGSSRASSGVGHSSAVQATPPSVCSPLVRNDALSGAVPLSSSNIVNDQSLVAACFAAKLRAEIPTDEQPHRDSDGTLTWRSVALTRLSSVKEDLVSVRICDRKDHEMVPRTILALQVCLQTGWKAFSTTAPDEFASGSCTTYQDHVRNIKDFIHVQECNGCGPAVDDARAITPPVPSKCGGIILPGTRATCCNKCAKVRHNSNKRKSKAALRKADSGTKRGRTTGPTPSKTHASSRVPFTHLTHAETLERLKNKAAELRKVQRKVRRLANVVFSMKEVTAATEELDELLMAADTETTGNQEARNHLQDIFKKDQSGRMREFWQDQMHALKLRMEGKPGAIRYSSVVLRIALAIHLKSPSAYDILRNTGVLALPCARHLKSYVAAYRQAPNLHAEIIEGMRTTWNSHVKELSAKKAAAEEKTKGNTLRSVPEPVGALVLDELKVRSGVVMTRDCRLVGYCVDPEDMLALDDLFRKKAKGAPNVRKTHYISQIQWKCLTSSIIINGPYFTSASQTSAQQAYEQSKATFEALAMRGLQTDVIVTDGESKNVTMMRRWITGASKQDWFSSLAVGESPQEEGIATDSTPTSAGPVGASATSSPQGRHDTVNAMERTEVEDGKTPGPHESTPKDGTTTKERTLDECLDKYTMKWWNPYTGRWLFYVIDPSHGLKNGRNSIHNSRPDGTTALQRDGKRITWEHIELLWDNEERTKRTATQSHLYTTGLTSEAVALTSYSKMRVPLALRAISLKVVRGLRDMGAEFESTAHWIETLHSVYPASLLSDDPLRTMQDPRFRHLETALQDLEKWEREHQEAVSKEKIAKPEASKAFLASITLHELRLTLAGFLSLARQFFDTWADRFYLSPRRVNSSSLESLFGVIRSMGGSNATITEHIYARNLAAYNTVKSVSLTSIQMNTEVRDQLQLNQDSFTAPLRRKNTERKRKISLTATDKENIHPSLLANPRKRKARRTNMLVPKIRI